MPLLLTMQASSYCELRMLDQAEDFLAEADALREADPESFDRDAVFGLAMVHGNTAPAAGDLRAAYDHYRSALDEAVEAVSLPRQFTALTQLAATCKLLGDFEAALVHQEERYRVHEDHLQRRCRPPDQDAADRPRHRGGTSAGRDPPTPHR